MTSHSVCVAGLAGSHSDYATRRTGATGCSQHQFHATVSQHSCEFIDACALPMEVGKASNLVRQCSRAVASLLCVPPTSTPAIRGRRSDARPFPYVARVHGRWVITPKPGTRHALHSSIPPAHLSTFHQASRFTPSHLNSATSPLQSAKSGMHRRCPWPPLMLNAAPHLMLAAHPLSTTAAINRHNQDFQDRQELRTQAQVAATLCNASQLMTKLSQPQMKAWKRTSSSSPVRR